MTYIVRFSPEAISQLDNIEVHITNSSSPATAARFVDAIVDYCESLQTFPYRGAKRDDIRVGLRTIGFNRHATIVFEVMANESVVNIIGVFYGGRSYENFKFLG